VTICLHGIVCNPHYEYSGHRSIHTSDYTDSIVSTPQVQQAARREINYLIQPLARFSTCCKVVNSIADPLRSPARHPSSLSGSNGHGSGLVEVIVLKARSLDGNILLDTTSTHSAHTTTSTTSYTK
jgi:hypothetical protein